MSEDVGRVVVGDALCTRCAVSAKQVHHRDFPEIRAECGSISEGATHLASQLSLYREGAQSDWHRGLIERAIADVAEFLDALAETERDAETACRCGARATVPAGPPAPDHSTCDGPEGSHIPMPI
jgi:hypothetical protein